MAYMHRFRRGVHPWAGTAVLLAIVGASISACGQERDSAAVETCAALADGDVVRAARSAHEITTTDLDLDVSDLQYMLDKAANSLSVRADTHSKLPRDDERVRQDLEWLQIAWRICEGYAVRMPDVGSEEWTALEEAVRRGLVEPEASEGAS
ncbi:hypothetical protein [Nocardioides caricicola]|uniref:DUF732 domain-containing protein n=1 Tax=Nocardioides caricicola TaxID=634770 RepID=A0ABW0N1Y6_9ACTN